jgi:hypothetical protein
LTSKRDSAVIEWLLEDDQPSVKYLALRGVLDKSENDSDVQMARKSLAKSGFAKQILDKQLPSGTWYHDKSLFNPTFETTFWMLLILSDFGLTKEDPRVDKAAQLWMQRNATKDGGFNSSSVNAERGHLCITGNAARMLVNFGYEDNAKVKKSFDWIVDNAAEKGGWSCWNFGSKRSGRTLDSWEPLSAFAAYPRQKWTRRMKDACERGAEFFLDRELHKQGARFEPWFRFHYPVHYYYDILVGLDCLTALGYAEDKRLDYAVSLLKEKRRADGLWNLDSNRPEDSPALRKFRKQHPTSKDFTPVQLEKPGEASKMITLISMRVLKRLGEID